MDEINADGYENISSDDFSVGPIPTLWDIIKLWFVVYITLPFKHWVKKRLSKGSELNG
jgi:hypothetical protein